MEVNSYITLEQVNETKIVEKGSIFNCYSYPIQTLDEAHSILESLKTKYYDASHFCYALSLVDNTVRHSDSGEPSGSAGIKIFNAIQHFNLKNVIVIIVRYFGGTKLGIGLLGKTYYNAAYENLDKAIKSVKKKYTHLLISADFEFIGDVYKLSSIYNLKIINSDYSNLVELDVLVLPEKCSQLNNELKNISFGKIQIKIIEDLYL